MSGFAAPDSSGKVPCRKCGFPLAPEASVCGNCGNRKGTRIGVGAGTGGSLADGRLPGGITKALVILGALAVGFMLVQEPALEALDKLVESFESATVGGDSDPGSTGLGDASTNGGGQAPGGRSDGVTGRTKGFGGVREVIKALNRGGLRCVSPRVDGADAYVASGSCQANGVHVQINVYLAETSLAAVTDSFFSNDFPFAFVLKDNTYVISQAAVARRVHDIIGGRFVPPRG